MILLVMWVFNLGILFAFKYTGFMAAALNDLFHTSFPVPLPPQPIGISFLTFKAISYVIDVYRQKVKVQKKLFYVALYISLFPQIEAGPVVQYASIEEQLLSRKENMRMFSVGFSRFITGLAKKVMIANHMAVIADNVFMLNASASIPATLAWVGSIAYTLQIYYDLSGYADMAIGLCLMVGFKINENFNYPYISKSITEFWRRWHISLTQWFKEYVYKPLGGSKLKNKDKVIRNLFIVWLLIGLWHGAEWTFLIWGLLNFAFIYIEKMLSIDKIVRYKVLRSIYTLFVINILWVIFRAGQLEDAGQYIASMFGANGFHSPYTFMFIKENVVYFLTGILFTMPVAKKMNKLIVEKAPFSSVINAVYPGFVMIIFVICVAYLIKEVQNPFIYFNF